MTLFHALDFTKGHEARTVLCGALPPMASTTTSAWVTCPACLKITEDDE